MIMFKKNLKNNIKNELMKTKIEIENLKNFIIECIRLNDMLYNQIIKKRFKNSREKFDIYAKKIFRKKHSHLKSKVKFYVNIVLMKLNVITRRKKTNFKKKRNNINKSTCFKCDKLNHYVKNCRLNVMFTR